MLNGKIIVTNAPFSHIKTYSASEVEMRISDLNEIGIPIVHFHIDCLENKESDFLDVAKNLQKRCDVYINISNADVKRLLLFTNGELLPNILSSALPTNSYKLFGNWQNYPFNDMLVVANERSRQLVQELCIFDEKTLKSSIEMISRMKHPRNTTINCFLGYPDCYPANKKTIDEVLDVISDIERIVCFTFFNTSDSDLYEYVISHDREIRIGEEDNNVLGSSEVQSEVIMNIIKRAGKRVAVKQEIDEMFERRGML